ADPYFLYGASNAGSALALISYPLIVERLLTLDAQKSLWSIACVGLALAVIACGAIALKNAAPEAPIEIVDAPPIPLLVRLRWIFFAFIPSSMMLGVTQYLTTDIASMPLLWILPLLIYLLSFTITFARRPLFGVSSATKLLPAIAVGIAVTLVF